MASRAARGVGSGDEVNAPRAYLDNVIVSGLVRGDLDPSEEKRAAEAMVTAAAEGRLIVETSAETHREQERAREDLRGLLLRHRPAIPRMSEDHVVLGSSMTTDQFGGAIVTPLVTDIVNEALLAALLAAGAGPRDAYHLMYAAHGRFQYFVTLDTKDILPQRAALEDLCSPLRIVTPCELMVSLEREGER